MNCKQAEEHFLDLAAGAVAPVAVQSHLAQCTACADRVAGLLSTMSLLEEWKAPEPSPYFDVRLRARLRAEAAPARSWFSWFRKPALAGAMAVLLVLGISLIQVDHNAYPGAGDVKIVAQPGTAVGDLQSLDKNHDLFADFDALDDLADQAPAPSGDQANP
jgi:hypothetical protein